MAGLGQYFMAGLGQYLMAGLGQCFRKYLQQSCTVWLYQIDGLKYFTNPRTQ